MDVSTIRQQIHKLVDEANEYQLEAVLKILTASNSLYTQVEMNSFYSRLKLFEESGSEGSSVANAHSNIRSKYS
jgi:hypothetical protein